MSGDSVTAQLALDLAPRLTRAEALVHKWWGQSCPKCSAEAGSPCKNGDPFERIHGQRTTHRPGPWVEG